MDTLISQYHTGNGDSVEEKICLRAFHAADTLKSRIRKTIFDYQQQGWELIGISIQGPCIHLKFKPSRTRPTTARETNHPMILTDNNFQKEVLENPQPVLVEITADWCGSCHIMAPVLERLAVEFRRQIKFGRLDVDANERTAEAYGMRKLPMLLFFKDGQLADSVIGVVSKSVLEARIKTLLQTAG
jgi:thioredoxin 1